MKLLIDADYIVYKCCAACETEIDYGEDVILVTSNFSEAYSAVIVNECLPPDGHQLSFVHDELNYECYPRFAEEFAKWLETAARLAGEHYNLRCPIAAEAKIGYTWADVH